MQQKDEKTSKLATTIGKILKEYRIKKNKGSINQFAHGYDLDVGNTSRIENGLTDIKLVTLWKISQALGVKASEIINIAENQLGEDFLFYEI